MSNQEEFPGPSGRQRLESSPLLHRIINQEDIEQLYRIFPDLPKSYRDGCPSCGKNDGEYVDGHIELNGEVYTCNCQDQLQRYKHYLNSGIGLNYQLLGWQDFHGDKEALSRSIDYVSVLKGNVEAGIGLFYTSPTYGCGKTMLASLILKECVLAGYKCYSTTFMDMISSMKAGWKDADYAKWYKNRVDSAQVLLIDDVGKELMAGSGFNNDYSKQTLDGLIRTRNQQGRPTFITTNLTFGDMERIYGGALGSLIIESTMGIEVRGEDYRPRTIKQPKGYRRIY